MLTEQEGLSSKRLSVPRGDVALTLFNVYSSLMLKTHLLTVVFDPVKLNLDKDDCDAQGVNAIVITHEHYDHFDEKLVLEMQKGSDAIIITTPFVAQKLEGIGEKVKGIRVGDSVKIKDVTFCAEYNEHMANQPLSFIIKTDTVTIYHPDDSDPSPGMKEIGNKYEPDIMLYMGTSEKDLIKITEMVRPSIVILHFDSRFADLKIPGVELRTLKQCETFRYPQPRELQ